MVVSVGVNVADSLGVPTGGTVQGVVKAKLPPTLAPAEFVAAPPIRVELVKAWPKVIALALGALAMNGVAWVTGTGTLKITAV